MIIRYKSIYEMTNREAMIALGEIVIRGLEAADKRREGIPLSPEEEEQLRVDEVFSDTVQEAKVRTCATVPDTPLGRGLQKMFRALDRAQKECPD